jgi:hypothetical protein
MLVGYLHSLESLQKDDCDLICAETRFKKCLKLIIPKSENFYSSSVRRVAAFLS